jgi:hypothetical protein
MRDIDRVHPNDPDEGGGFSVLISAGSLVGYTATVRTLVGGRWWLASAARQPGQICSGICDCCLSKGTGFCGRQCRPLQKYGNFCSMQETIRDQMAFHLSKLGQPQKAKFRMYNKV